MGICTARCKGDLLQRSEVFRIAFRRAQAHYPSTMNTNIDVALILWNTDVIDLVSFVLLNRNLKSCGLEPSEGREKIEDFILSCSPRVVMFDLDPPYDRSAALASHLLSRFTNCCFVMTCADPNLALKEAPWLSRHVLFQKPYEIDEIANTARSMVGSAAARAVTLSLGLSWRGIRHVEEELTPEISRRHGTTFRTRLNLG